jgi:hypothetical protein
MSVVFSSSIEKLVWCCGASPLSRCSHWLSTRSPTNSCAGKWMLRSRLLFGDIESGTIIMKIRLSNITRARMAFRNCDGLLTQLLCCQHGARS